MPDIIDEANKVLSIFQPNLRFIRLHRLCLAYSRDGVCSTHFVRVSKNSGALSGSSDRKLGVGGTSRMAIGQLARWIRGQSRVPIAAWEYWASETIYLARDRGDELVAAVKRSSYGDGKKTHCVLCGADRCSDWWSLDNVVGPCYGFGECCKKK